MAEDRDLGLPGSAVPAVWPDLPAVYGDVFRTFSLAIVLGGVVLWGVYGEEKPEFHVL